MQERERAVSYFRKDRCRLCDRRIAFARSSAECVAGAALFEGQVQILWQVNRQMD